MSSYQQFKEHQISDARDQGINLGAYLSMEISKTVDLIKSSKSDSRTDKLKEKLNKLIRFTAETNYSNFVSNTISDARAQKSSVQEYVLKKIDATKERMENTTFSSRQVKLYIYIENLCRYERQLR